MIKKAILDSSIAYFSKYGIKSVSMDFISKELRVSKKTLYELFSDKQDLVTQSVRYETGRIVETAQELKSGAESQLEIIVIQSALCYAYFTSFCPAFFRDLQKFPEAVATIDEYHGRLEDMHRALLAEGIAGGIFIDEANHDIMSRIIAGQIAAIKTEHGSDRVPLSEFLLMVTIILKGVCTEKGLVELARVKEKWLRPEMTDKLIIRKSDNI